MESNGIVFINTRNSVYADFFELIAKVPVLNRELLGCFVSLRATRNILEEPYFLYENPNQETKDAIFEGWEKRAFAEKTPSL